MKKITPLLIGSDPSRASLPSVLSLYFCFKTLDGCKTLAQNSWISTLKII